MPARTQMCSNRVSSVNHPKCLRALSISQPWNRQNRGAAAHSSVRGPSHSLHALYGMPVVASTTQNPALYPHGPVLIPEPWHCAQCCPSTWSTCRAAQRCRMRRAPASAAARKGCCPRGPAPWTMTCCWPRCGRGRASTWRHTALRVRGPGLHAALNMGAQELEGDVGRVLGSGEGLQKGLAPGLLL